MVIADDLDRPHRERVEAGVIHTAGHRHRGWREELKRFYVSQFGGLIEENFQFFFAVSRMADHKIIFQELPAFLIEGLEIFQEPVELRIVLVHQFKHFIREMLRRNLKAAGNVVRRELADIFFAVHRKVVSYPRADEDFFDAGDLAGFAEQRDDFRMAPVELGAVHTP